MRGGWELRSRKDEKDIAYHAGSGERQGILLKLKVTAAHSFPNLGFPLGKRMEVPSYKILQKVPSSKKICTYLLHEKKSTNDPTIMQYEFNILNYWFPEK